MRRRTDFEHRIASRSTKPKDYALYAEYEKNVEKLRLKRVERLSREKAESVSSDSESDSENNGKGAKKTKLGHGISSYAGPRRIYFIYDRGTKKFPNEIATLWLPYLNYANSQNATFVISKIYTRLLQLHPTKAQVWIMAAKYELQTHNSIKAARLILQRAIRLNYGAGGFSGPNGSLQLWVEYFKLELIYVAQLLAKRKIMGIVTEAQQLEMEREENEGLNFIVDGDNVEESKVRKSREDDVSEQKDVIELPSTQEIEQQAKEQLNSLPNVDVSMLGSVETNPALRGDIALTVFDCAIPHLLKYTTHDIERQKIILKLLTQCFKVLDIFYSNSNKNSNKSEDDDSNLDLEYLGTHLIETALQQITSLFDPAGIIKASPQIALLDTILPIRFVPASSPLFADATRQLLSNYTTKYIKDWFKYSMNPNSSSNSTISKNKKNKKSGSTINYQAPRIEYAQALAQYLKSRFQLLDEEQIQKEYGFESEKASTEQVHEHKEQLEPNLAMIIKGLVAKCETQQ